MRKASARGSVSQEQATQVTVNQTFHWCGCKRSDTTRIFATAPMARDSAIEGLKKHVDVGDMTHIRLAYQMPLR